MVVSVPAFTSDTLVMDNNTNLKEFTVNLMMVMHYEARGNWRTYANAIISTLESLQSQFDAIGYYELKIEAETPRAEEISQTQVITGDFKLIFKGYTNR
jgi:hypothetical protein